MVLTCSIAQNTNVVLSPVRAGSLSGVIVDPVGGVVPHATVTLVDCPVAPDSYSFGHEALASAESDSKGEFSLNPKGYKQPYCLRVSSPGFNPLEFRVKISPFGGRMHLVLPIAA